jgi:hypothetical protein
MKLKNWNLHDLGESSMVLLYSESEAAWCLEGDSFISQVSVVRLS